MKFHVSAGIEPTPSCAPSEHFDHHTTEARYASFIISKVMFIKCKVQIRRCTYLPQVFLHYMNSNSDIINYRQGGGLNPGHRLCDSPLIERIEDNTFNAPIPNGSLRLINFALGCYQDGCSSRQPCSAGFFRGLTLLVLVIVNYNDSYSPRQLGSPMEAHGGEPQLLNCKSDSSKSFTIRFGVMGSHGINYSHAYLLINELFFDECAPKGHRTSQLKWTVAAIQVANSWKYKI
ncbi:hypothetical protein M8J77_014202 [Diaphorina citri]|nr:hypothetical protein M8J77_014202 [Diaphorina citri]